MALWLIRSGKDEIFSEMFLKYNMVAVAWKVPDLSNTNSIEDMIKIFSEAYPNDKEKTLENWSRQMWSFKEKISIGEMIITPFNKSSYFAIGRVVGDYEYRNDISNDAKHTRNIEWLRSNIKHRDIKSDVLSSLRSILTVCQISKNNAEEYIKTII